MVATSSVWQDALKHDTALGNWQTRSADVNEEVQELRDVMHHWSRREAFVFCDRPSKSADSAEESGNNGAMTIDQRTRARIVELLHVLLSSCDGLDDFPVAMTLFDALGVKYSQGLCSFSMTSPAIVIAVARIALVSSGTVSELDFQVEEFALELLHHGEEEATPAKIAEAEVDIIRVLDGRLKLMSPSEWCRIMVDHLRALGAPQKDLDSVLPNIMQWAADLVEGFAATASLPPQALGLLACIMGLVSSGKLVIEDLRPPNLAEEDWENALFKQIGNTHGIGVQEQRERGDATINIALLSEVFNCSSEKLCQRAFDLSDSLRIRVAMGAYS